MGDVAQVYSSGKCGCLDYDLSQGDDWKTLYYNSTIAFDTVLGDDYDDETKREVIAAVCTSTSFLGDHSHVCVTCACSFSAICSAAGSELFNFF